MNKPPNYEKPCWLFNDVEIISVINPEETTGFIYKITHIPTGKFYIGKKTTSYILKRPPLKGRKNKRHVVKETDWKTYWGSSTQLHEDIEKYGAEEFKREILHWCFSKWELAYYEAKYQFDYEVIFRKDSYNGILNLRVPKAPKHLQK